MLDSDELEKAVKQVRIRDSRIVEKEFRVTVGERRILLRIFMRRSAMSIIFSVHWWSSMI